MTETRPPVNALISVAEVVVLRDLMAVDCSADSDGRVSLALMMSVDQPEPHERERIVWSAINTAFSEPVNRSDGVAEYAPTQVLAEAFRSRYDGILYASNLGSGKNLAIFDVTAAKVTTRHLYRVEAVKMTFVEEADPHE